MNKKVDKDTENNILRLNCLYKLQLTIIIYWNLVSSLDTNTFLRQFFLNPNGKTITCAIYI